MQNSHRSEAYIENGKKRPSLASIAGEVIKSEAAKSRSCCGEGKTVGGLATFLEKCFFSFGLQIGQRPWMTILLSLVLCGVCTAGMAFWQVNSDDEALWTPYGSPFIEQREWILANFPKDTRYETLILSAAEPGANALTAQNVQYLLRVHEAVTNISSTTNVTYEDLCFRFPSSNEEETGCATKSILGIWSYNESIISQLTDEEVLTAVSERLSQQNLQPLEQIDQILAGVEFLDDGKRVARASAIMNIWLLKQNGTKEADGNLVDEVAKQWEKAFIDQIILDRIPGLHESINFDALAERSLDDGINDTVDNNFQVMFGGFTLLFLYIALTLGRWDSLEQRVVLSFSGVVVIGLSLGASFGFCFYMGIFFARLHPVIPFLLLGIGVDDMYVIVQALDNLKPEDKSRPVHHRIGKALEHAGVSITVTSVTDMAAFFIGSSTSMPILRAFCLFAAVGVLFLYIFAITFFVGCLTLDERRIEARKVFNLDCIPPKPQDWTPSKCSTKNHGKHFFQNVYGSFLTKPIVQALVVLITIVFAGFGAYGVFHIELNFDSIWYMNQNSYQTRYFKRLQTSFPESGERVEVYTGEVPYWLFNEEMAQIESILQSSKYIRNDSVEFWYTKFNHECCGANTKNYCLDYFDWYNDVLTCSDELGFKRKMLLFLKQNPFYAQDLRFNISLEELSEEEAMDVYVDGSYQITASRARFQHNHLKNTAIKTLAMYELKNSLNEIQFNKTEAVQNDSNFLESPIAYSFMYVQWEANDIISDELIRNLSITFGTIAIVTILIIVNIKISAMVFVCVVLSVMNVCGFSHYMGLTIEIVSSINLILSVGLALDYSAHVGVIFACHKTGSREEKMKITLGEIGTAVLNGGISTLLAFVLLGASDSYAFLTFFKMFAMVVFFGLFHGLVLLPVLLCLIGPKSPSSSNSKGNDNPAIVVDVEN